MEAQLLDRHSQLRSCGEMPRSRRQQRMRLPNSNTCRMTHRRVMAASTDSAATASSPTANSDEIYKSLSTDAEVTLTVISARNVVQDGCSRHECAPTASAALGRVLIGSLLLAAFREEREATQVTFKGGGEVGDVQAVATAEGQVKGKLDNPAGDPPLRADGKLAVGTAIGSNGFLSIVRSHPESAQPYTGMIPLVSGEVAEDLAAYLADSEQTNCALGLGVSIGRDNQVQSAGGFLLQVLPFASEETLSALEANLQALGPISELLQSGLSPRQITGRILGDLEAEGEGFSIIPTYGPCDTDDLEQRMKRAVAALGAKEIQDIVEEQGKLEITCDFCKTTLVLDHESLLSNIDA